ncbi:MAG: cobalamin-binding protein [Dehalococcoidales bacterium]|nr:cobalamin-binding protein [Dehalococcoidales bacterium]
MKGRLMKGIFKTIGLIFVGVAILAGMLGGCGNATPIQSTFSITDSFGRTITIADNNPQKIVSLAPSNTEILFALGLGDRVVGVTDFCNYPEEATTKQSVGAYDNPDIETIVSLAPDLVLATDAQSEDFYLQMENRGLTVVAIVPGNLSEVLDSITLIGQITGQDDEAATLVDSLQAKVDAINAKTSQLTEAQKPRVFYIIWDDPIWTTGVNTFEDALIIAAGGINIADETTGYSSMTLEAVLDANPQIMIAGVGMGTGMDMPYQFIQNEPRLENTDARKNGNIFSFDMDIISRPGPRIFDALEQLFALIHPELQ